MQRCFSYCTSSVTKADFNAHLDPDRWMCPLTAAGRRQFRTDYLAVRASGRQSLAFEFPHKTDFWLHFPARSNVVSLLNLHHIVVVPQDSDDLIPTRLIGSTPPGCDWEPIPTVSFFGRYLLDTFASAVELKTPQDAEVVLQKLFDQCGQLYIATREQLWGTHVAPRVFRCGPIAQRRLRTVLPNSTDTPLIDQFLNPDVLEKLKREPPRSARPLPLPQLPQPHNNLPQHRRRFSDLSVQESFVDPSEVFMQR